jgi:hypothetical protein
LGANDSIKLSSKCRPCSGTPQKMPVGSGLGWSFRPPSCQNSLSICLCLCFVEHVSFLHGGGWMTVCFFLSTYYASYGLLVCPCWWVCERIGCLELGLLRQDVARRRNRT